MNYWIVVVDDDALSLKNAKSILGAQGMRVSCLRSGRELLVFMEKNIPDLILLDIMMPEMDGFETFHALRELEEHNDRMETPVIFLTGDTDSETERRGLRDGASDFIHKPFTQEVLVKRIFNTITNSRTIKTLTEEATTDKLTGLLNKASGTKSVAQLCLKKSGALVVLDLDNFKLVNDLYGHDMGDKVLATFAELIKHNTRTGDVAARIGGDEFLAFLCNMQDKESVDSLTVRLNNQLLIEARKLMGDDFDIPLGISVGAAFIPEHSRDYDTLFQYADSALVKVKQNGKHGFEIYHTETEEDIDDPRREIARLSKILGERGPEEGALLIGQEAFSILYKYIIRMVMRDRGEAAKILFSLKTKEEQDSTVFHSKAEIFGQVLQKGLRKSDIIMQSRPHQYFVLLPNISEENIDSVTDRILRVWNTLEGPDDVTVEITVEAMSFKT